MFPSNIFSMHNANVYHLASATSYARDIPPDTMNNEFDITVAKSADVVPYARKISLKTIISASNIMSNNSHTVLGEKKWFS